MKTEGTLYLSKNTTPSQSTKGDTVVRFVALFALLLGFAARILWLGKQEVWFDEAASAFIASKSVPDIISYIQGQQFEHPPIYYLLLHGWIQLTGTGEFALRYFSLLLGVLFLALLRALVRPFASASVSLTTILIAAVFPFQIVQSQEARMYTFLACLGALTILTFHRALMEKKASWWIGCGVVTAIGVGTHYYFPLLPIALGAYVLLRRHSYLATPRKWLLAMAILAVPPLIVWLLVSDGPRSAVVHSFRNWSLAQANAADMEKLAIEAVFGISGVTKSVVVEQIGSLAVLATAVLGLGLGKRSGVLRSPENPAYAHSLHSILGFSLILPFLFSLLLPHNVVARYLSFSSAALYILVGVGIVALGKRLRLLSVLALLGILLMASFVDYSYFRNVGKGEFGAAARVIREASLPDDAIVLNHPDQWPFVKYYLPAERPIVYYVPGAPRPPSDEEVGNAMAYVAAQHGRIWLGPASAWNMDPQSKVDHWLLRNAYRSFEYWLPGSTAVSLFYKPAKEPAYQPGQYNVGSYLQLRGYAMSKETVSPSGAVMVRLSWQILAAPHPVLLQGLKLIGEDGRVWSDMTDVIVAGQETDSKRALSIPPGTPPGKYRIELSVLSTNERGNLLFRDSSTGAVRGASLTLGEVAVSSPTRPVPIPVKTSPTTGVFGQQIELLGIERRESTYRQGDVINLAIVWRALVPPPRDYQLLFQFLDSRGGMASEVKFPVSTLSYPTSKWKAGEYIKGIYDVPISSDLIGGEYELRIALQDASSGKLLDVQGERWSQALGGLWTQKDQLRGDGMAIARVVIGERERVFTAPSPAVPLAESLGDQVKLVGYDGLPTTLRPGDHLSLTLYWQAMKTVKDSYTVFVHLLDGKGQLVAQQDVPPREGKYPTNLWVTGEYIIDPHSLVLPDSLPPGQYTVEVGMYDQLTLKRLPVLGLAGSTKKEDSVLFSPIAVVQ